MAESSQLSKDLMDVLAKHGVSSLPSAATAANFGRVTPGAAASWIREIITSDQAFDETMLTRVVGVLNKPR